MCMYGCTHSLSRRRCRNPSRNQSRDADASHSNTSKDHRQDHSPLTDRATGLFSPLDSSIVNTFPSFRGRARDRLTTEQNRASRVISFLPRSNCQLLLAPSPSPSYYNTRTSAASSASSSPWAAAWRRWFEWSVLRCRLATD